MKKQKFVLVLLSMMVSLPVSVSAAPVDQNSSINVQSSQQTDDFQQFTLRANLQPDGQDLDIELLRDGKLEFWFGTHATSDFNVESNRNLIFSRTRNLSSSESNHLTQLVNLLDDLSYSNSSPSGMFQGRPLFQCYLHECLANNDFCSSDFLRQMIQHFNVNPLTTSVGSFCDMIGAHIFSTFGFSSGEYESIVSTYQV